MRVRLAIPSDAEEVSRLCELLWPESTFSEHLEHVARVLADFPTNRMPLVIFVADSFAGGLAGFVEVGLRSHADGCDPQCPVGFVEGWFVREGDRQRGVGARLLAAAEEWAREQGCSEMASDTWIDNPISQLVHEKLNFQVVDRCVHYRKLLKLGDKSEHDRDDPQ